MMSVTSKIGQADEGNKTPDLDRFFREIGQEASDLSQERSGKFLVYADVEDSVTSISLFFVDQEGVVRYRSASETLERAVYSFWEFCREKPEFFAEWRVMSFVLDGTKLDVQLTFPDQIDKEERSINRRGRAIEKHFGNVKVEYPKPIDAIQLG